MQKSENNVHIYILCFAYTVFNIEGSAVIQKGQIIAPHTWHQHYFKFFLMVEDKMLGK